MDGAVGHVWVVFVVVLSCAGYFLFHVNEVQQCAHYQRNGSILGIAGKLLLRRDTFPFMVSSSNTTITKTTQDLYHSYVGSSRIPS